MATRQTKTKTKRTNKTVSDVQMAKAQEAGQYIKAADTGALRITGAEKRWKTQPDIVYNVAYHLVGTPQEIRDVLSRGNLDAAEIDRTMAEDLITRTNYKTTMAEEYEREIALATDARKAQKIQQAKNPKLTLADLTTILKTLDIKAGTIGPAKTTITTKESTGTKKAASPRSRGPRSPLIERLEALDENSVYDVSDMDASGVGAKKAKVPKGKSKRVMVPGLAIVSTNYDAYKRATDLLGPDYARFAEQYAQMYGTGPEALIPATSTISPKSRTKATKTTAKAPTKSTTKAPARPKAPAPASAAVPATTATAQPSTITRPVTRPSAVPSATRTTPSTGTRTLAARPTTGGISRPGVGTLGSMLRSRSPTATTPTNR
jgi:hypothetical protein